MAPFAYLLSISIVIARSNRKCELYMLASIRFTVYHKSIGFVQSETGAVDGVYITFPFLKLYYRR
jgi:hypothetical protein